MVKNHSVREETRCRHYSVYSVRLAIQLYALSYRQDSIYHSLYLTSHGTLAEIEKSLNGSTKTSHFSLSSFHSGTREREKNVLFNDALSTFYLRLYGVRHMVKDHSDSEKGNPLPPHRLLFPINSKGSFICTIPQTG